MKQLVANIGLMDGRQGFYVSWMVRCKTEQQMINEWIHEKTGGAT